MVSLDVRGVGDWVRGRDGGGEEKNDGESGVRIWLHCPEL